MQRRRMKQKCRCKEEDGNQMTPERTSIETSMYRPCPAGSRSRAISAACTPLAAYIPDIISETEAPTRTCEGKLGKKSKMEQQGYTRRKLK